GETTRRQTSGPEGERIVPTTFTLEVSARLPPELARRPELADNLSFSWEPRIRGLFWRLDAGLWRGSGHHPKVFLRQVSQQKLEAAASDADFLREDHGALAPFDSSLPPRRDPVFEPLLQPGEDLVAYFCAEYGFHESLPIYSGGLG